MIDIHDDRYGRAVFRFGGHVSAAFAEKSRLLRRRKPPRAEKKGRFRVDIGRSGPIFSRSPPRRSAANRRKSRLPARFAARDDGYFEPGISILDLGCSKGPERGRSRRRSTLPSWRLGLQAKNRTVGEPAG